MAAISMQKASFATSRVARTPASRRGLSTRVQASRPLWAPEVEAPEYLNGTLAGDRGFDPLGFGANPQALLWYQQSELVHARWAMLGVAGVLVQEVVKPDVYFYEAGLPQNLPGPFKDINMGGLLAWEFILMHFVEVIRWQDYKNFGSVNEDPIFKGNKISNVEMGYPGFDPAGLSKGDFADLKTKEIKNGRLAMIAFMSFVIQAQATGKGPLAALAAHLSDPFGNNIATNIGTCTVPSSIDVQGLTIPLTCLWPGQH